MSHPLRVLLVEDSVDDASLLLSELRNGGYEPVWERVDTAADLRVALGRHDWDLITCDWVLPGFGAPEALRLIQAQGHSAPIILVSGEVGEEVAVSALKAGAADFVSKHRLARLVPAVARELREAEVRRARHRAESALTASQQYFRSLIENAWDLISVMDTAGTIRYASPSHERALGYRPDELVGTCAFDFLHPDDLPRVVKTYQDGIANDQIGGRTEFRFRHRDGSWRLFEGVAKIALDDPHVRGIIVTTRDIEDRKRTEEERDRLIKAVEQTPESILITNADGTFVYANPASERMTGYTQADLRVGGPRLVRQQWADTAGYKQMVATLARGDAWRGRATHVRKDGSLYEVDAIVSLVFDAAGRVISYVGAGRDVTHERQVEAQLHRTQHLEAIAHLAGGVAHYFNNQLTVIKGCAQFLVADLPPGDGRRDAALIGTTADQCAQLVHQLSLFSRRARQDTCLLNLSRVVTEMVPMLRLALGEQITLRLRPAPDLWPVRADRSQLEHVVMQLVANARDAIVENGRPAAQAHITIETANVAAGDDGQLGSGKVLPSGPQVVLVVSDNGRGIAPDVREHIFEPFFTTKDVGKGTGLGLAAVFGIVRQHRGSVVCVSEPGHGAMFRVYLPVDSGAQLATSASAGAATVDHTAGDQGTILLVDEDEGVRAVLAHVLEQARYRVFSAASAAAALAEVERVRVPIDLLIADVALHGAAGPALAERLLEQCGALRVLYISTYAADTLGLPTPGARFLAKPFNLDELLGVVRDLMPR